MRCAWPKRILSKRIIQDKVTYQYWFDWDIIPFQEETEMEWVANQVFEQDDELLWCCSSSSQLLQVRMAIFAFTCIYRQGSFFSFLFCRKWCKNHWRVTRKNRGKRWFFPTESTKNVGSSNQVLSTSFLNTLFQ